MITKKLHKLVIVMNAGTEFEEVIDFGEVKIAMPHMSKWGPLTEMEIVVAPAPAMVNIPLPSMLPVLRDSDWRWSYDYSRSRWELQKHYADKWHLVQYWGVGSMFENPGDTRGHVRRILNQAGVEFTEQPAVADPELERLLREEEEINDRIESNEGPEGL